MMNSAVLMSTTLAILLYYSTLNAGFVYDDSRAVVSNPDVVGEGGWGLWRSDFWGTALGERGSHGSYRPLVVLTFRLTYLVFGLRPWAFHAGNVLLHGLVAGLVAWTARRLLPRGRGSLLAGLLFAAHPVHTEAVAGVVGRADLLAALFTLLSLLLYMGYAERRHYQLDLHASVLLAGCLLSATAAVLSKETGVAALVICALYDILRATNSKSKGGGLSVSVLVLICWSSVLLWFRLSLPGCLPKFSQADNPSAHHPSLLARSLTFLYLPAFNGLLLLFPSTLSFDWSMDAVPRIESLSDRRNLLTLSFYLLLYKFSKFSLSHLLTSPRPQGVTPSQSTLLCLSFLVFPFLPASNLFFYVGFVVAERVLYIPSVGYCLLVALGYSLLSPRVRGITLLVFILLVAFSSKTVFRNYAWKDEETLYRAGISINPPKAYGNLGSVLGSQGRYDEAEKAYRLALALRPNMAEVHYNLGNLLQNRQRYSEAISSYKQAIRYRPSLAVAYLNLGQALLGAGRCGEGEAVLERCASLGPEGVRDPGTHQRARLAASMVLARRLSQRGSHAAALALYTRVTHHLHGFYQPQVVYGLMGESLSLMGQEREAERWFKAALSVQPQYIPSYINYGKHLARNKTRISEAEELFKRAQNLAPSDPKVYQHFGDFLSELERHSEAANSYRRAAELSPSQYHLILSAATETRRAGNLREAEILYRQAAELRPMAGESHSNLGAILHLNGKLSEASECYRKALQLDPTDITTLTNLKKLQNLLIKYKT